MANVEIYTWSTCPYCARAKDLLKTKGIDYVEYDITGDDDARGKMIDRTGGPKSVPQIFIDDIHYGGNDDLHALDAEGKLDMILKG